MSLFKSGRTIVDTNLTQFNMLLSMDVMKVRDWTYLEDPPKDIGPARHLLEVYSKIPYNDLDGHIRRVVSTCPRTLAPELI